MPKGPHPTAFMALRTVAPQFLRGPLRAARRTLLPLPACCADTWTRVLVEPCSRQSTTVDPAALGSPRQHPMCMGCSSVRRQIRVAVRRSERVSEVDGAGIAQPWVAVHGRLNGSLHRSRDVRGHVPEPGRHLRRYNRQLVLEGCGAAQVQRRPCRDQHVSSCPQGVHVAPNGGVRIRGVCGYLGSDRFRCEPRSAGHGRARQDERSEAEVPDQTLTLCVKEKVPRLEVVVKEPQVVGPCDTHACLTDKSDDVVHVEPAASRSCHERVQRAVCRELRYQVRLPGIVVCIPDREDVVVNEPPENLGFLPHPAGRHAAKELDRNDVSFEGVERLVDVALSTSATEPSMKLVAATDERKWDGRRHVL